MFTVYAIDLANPAGDTETECATLEEALCHLRELITSEMEVEQPTFDRYGIALLVTPSAS